MCNYIKKILRMPQPIADSECQKFVLVVQKQLGMNKFVRTKSPTGSKIS